VSTARANRDTEFASYRRSADGVAWITLTDGDNGNPVHPEMVADLSDAVGRAHEQHVRVIVLKAEGRYFSVGGDIARFAAERDVEAYLSDLVRGLNRVLLSLMQSDAIVVAAVQGPAAGGGLPLAATADIVVAARSATLSLGYSRLGLTIDAGASLLTRSLGLHQALRLALLNDRVSADEALSLGLVARVFEDTELTLGTEALVDRLARGPMATQARIKTLVRSADQAPKAVLEAEATAIARAAHSVDGREGVRAFLDKRAPEFSSETS